MITRREAEEQAQACLMYNAGACLLTSLALALTGNRPRWYGHSFEMNEQGRQPDKAEEVRCLLFVAGGDATESFDGAEEPLDDISIAVPDFVVVFAGLPCFVGADAGFPMRVANFFPDRVAVVSGVGNHMRGMQPFQESLGLGSIARLP